MQIQSLSIVVPTKKCVNKCKFCVSKMHETLQDSEDGFDSFNIEKRLKYAQANGITTCIITGSGEPLQNRNFLVKLANLFNKLDHPFPNVELQTTGIFLLRTGISEYDFVNLTLLKRLGVNTISLSVSDLFDDELNMNIIGMPEQERFKLSERIFTLKIKGFNVRLSLNMTNSLEDYSVTEIFEKLQSLGVDQITFRKLWAENLNTSEAQWVSMNKLSGLKIDEIINYIIKNGYPLYKLPYGNIVYSIDGMSTIIDDDCMSDESYNYNALKYVILQSDSKLYCRWNDKGSLIF